MGLSTRIRVAHIALQLDTGGMERLLTDFARHADRGVFDLRFVALSRGGRLAREIEGCGWPVATLDTPPGLRPTLVHRLTRLFAADAIDIVHTHNTKPLLYAGPAARLARVGGVVHTRHGQRRGATALQHGMFRLASRCADRMVCVSEDAARLCRTEGVDSARVTTIPNGIDTKRFAFAGPTPPGPVVYVGRLSPEKDVATLLRAAALAVAEDPCLQLVIAGDGPCRAELTSLAASLRLASHVQFLGEVADIPALLRKASVFVLPSLSEGLPITVLEAMACGTPVVATRVGGTPEAVEHGRTGFLVPPGDDEQMAAAVIRILRDRVLAHRMSLMGRERIESRFDIRSMVVRYESLYREVLNPPTPSRRAAAA